MSSLRPRITPTNGAPVFYDPTHLRWTSFVALSGTISACMAIVLAVLAVQIYRAPNFQPLELSAPDARNVVQVVNAQYADPGEGFAVNGSAQVSLALFDVPMVSEPEWAESDERAPTLMARRPFFLN